MATNNNPNRGSMTVREAGKKGGQKVRDLINRGKRAEGGEER